MRFLLLNSATICFNCAIIHIYIISLAVYYKNKVTNLSQKVPGCCTRVIDLYYKELSLLSHSSHEHVVMQPLSVSLVKFIGLLSHYYTIWNEFPDDIRYAVPAYISFRSKVKAYLF